MLISENSGFEAIKADTEQVKCLLNFFLLLVHHPSRFAEARHISLNAVVHIFIDLFDVITESCFEKMNKLEFLLSELFLLLSEDEVESVERTFHWYQVFRVSA